MKKSDFKKLTKDQRVVVNGTMDEEAFSNRAGVIKSIDFSGDVLVRFDNWKEGHGEGLREWYFRADDARRFNIVPEALAPKVEPKPAKKRPHGAQEYKGNGKHSWEHVTASDDSGYVTERLRVPGGWLYRDKSGGGYTKAVTFVPVPQAVGYAV